MPARQKTKKEESTQNPDLLALTNQLCFALYSSSLEMTKLYRPLLEPLKLTYSQYLAMLVLWEQGGSLVKELGAKLHLDSGTLTPLLKRLEKMGLVSRDRDPADERGVIVKVTKQGEQRKRKPAASPALTRCDSAPANERTVLGGPRQRDQGPTHAQPDRANADSRAMVSPTSPNPHCRHERGRQPVRVR
jgi:MarR family transcriptional regulator, organic hydroperoxide resistance regulator